MGDSSVELAELYDVRTRDWADDVPAILRAVAAYGPRVLELGCGTGRVLRALDKAGYADAVGLDSDAGVIEVARRVLPTHELLVQAMQELDVGRSFDVVLVPFNALELLPSSRDVLSTLQRIREHCRPGGGLFIDTQPATFDATKLEAHVPMRRLRQIVDPTRGPVDVFFGARRDPLERSSHCTMLYRWAAGGVDHTAETSYVVRPLTVDELFLSLRASGFELVSAHGDYRDADYDPRIHNQLNVLARRPER